MAKRGRSGPVDLENSKENGRPKKKIQKKIQREENHEKQLLASSEPKGNGNLGQGSRAPGGKGKDSPWKKNHGKGKNKVSNSRRIDEAIEDEDEQEEGEGEVGHVEKPQDGLVNGEGSRCSGRKGSKPRHKKPHEEEGYEGPVDEEDSESSSQDDDESEDDGDEDSSDDDEIRLDGILMRNPEEDSGEEEEEEAGGGEHTLVSVSLDFCDPDERFFHGIRSLVAHTYLQDAAGSGLSPLVDLVVAQGAVGTVLSTEGEDDAVFGFVTALPLRYLARDNRCAQDVIKYLLDKAAKGGRGAEMEAILGAGAAAGLLVSERMINCPIQAVPKLYEALVEDIAWAVKNEISQEHRDKFRFDNLLVVAPCDDISGGRADGSGVAMLSDFSFGRFDEEVLLQEAEFFFSMSCAVSRSSGGGGSSSSAAGESGHQRYVVGVIPATKLEECAKEIAQMAE